MIKKSKGVTPTEQFLSKLCEKTFLGLWSYSNPFNEEGKEICDLIAIFDNHVFIFFDRKKVLSSDFMNNPEVDWQRWYRGTVQEQISSCFGAERYLRTGRKIFLEQDLKNELPIRFDHKTANFYKIIVANGAQEMCKAISVQNVNGSIGITYSDSRETRLPNFPFCIELDRNSPVHLLDSFNLPILLSEIDTFHDLLAYFSEKEAAISKYKFLSYCGEEDLIANYFSNFDEIKNKHYIGVLDENISGVLIPEGEWNDFINTPAYNSRKEENKKSYFWDEILHSTIFHAMNDKLIGNSDIINGESAIYEMAKEPRFMRRILAENMLNAIKNFPESSKPIVRTMSFMPSYQKNVAYVFLQLKVSPKPELMKNYREVRSFMLEVACGAAKNYNPQLEKIIGIAIEPPKYFTQRSEDFILLDCKEWPDERRIYYDEENSKEEMHFFISGNLIKHEKNFQEFPV